MRFMKKAAPAGLALVLLAALVVGQDATTYQSKIYLLPGGDEMIVKSGGAITVNTGGTLTVAGVTINASTLALTDLTATAAELNKNAGVTGGTATASKTVVLDSSKDIAGIHALTLGTNGVGGAAGSLVVRDGANPGAATTITKAEVDLIDGVTAGTSAASKVLSLDASSQLDALLLEAAPRVVGASVGTAAYSTALEGLDGMHRTVFTLAVSGSDLVTLADGAHGGGKIFYTFPAGQIYVLGATLNATVTNTAAFNASTADTFSFAIGTVAGADDDDLTSTEANIIAKATVDTDSGGTTTRTVTGAMTTPAVFDGHTTAITLGANFAVAAANNSASNDFTVTGTLTVVWSNLGDY